MPVPPPVAEPEPGAPDVRMSRPPAPAAGKRGGRILRLALAGAGIVLFVLVFRSVGWTAIAANLARVGAWFPALIAIYSVAQIAFALGWWVVFDPRPPFSTFPRLFAVYLAGDAANALAPGNVAGEPLKVHLLRPATGGAPAVASVTIHKHADMAAQWVFMATGVAIALARFPMPAAARVAAIVATAGFGAALAAMTFVLPRRAYSPILARLARVRPLARPLARFQGSAARVDDRLASFYAARSAHFFAAAAWCFVGWCGGLVETWILLRLLVPGAGWAHAFAIEGLAMTLNNVFLFVPGRIGSAEGVRVGVFVLLGLAPAAGAAYSLLRRGRELAWMIPGLVVLGLPRGDRS